MAQDTLPPNYDKDFCGNIPISFLNLIQPHGLLLVLDLPKLTIVQSSVNALQFVGLEVRQLIGKPLEKFIGQDKANELLEQVKNWHTDRQLPVELSWEGERHLQGLIHPKTDYWVMELEVKETSAATSVSSVDFFHEISYVMSALKAAQSLEALYAVAAKELKQLSGFDRVMVYQFDEDWHGQVVAEAMDGQFESYLGLRFPASDVPKPARDLYFRTPYRLIVDAEAEGVALYPVLNPHSKGMLDLSDSILRFVPNVHREYLKNMGVRASMSTPLIIDNRLWGLISCHHQQAKWVSPRLRAAFEMLSGVLATQINAYQKAEAFQQSRERHSQMLGFVEQMLVKQSMLTSFQRLGSELVKMLQASGAILTYVGVHETIGEVPDKRFVKSLIKWLGRYHQKRIETFNSLPRVYSEAKAYRTIASGLLAIQLGDAQHYLLVFRPEQVKTVAWGGNPYDAVRVETDQRYHPRNSFQLWKQEVEFTSKAWGEEEKETAGLLRTALLEKLLQEAQEA